MSRAVKGWGLVVLAAFGLGMWGKSGALLLVCGLALFVLACLVSVDELGVIP